MIPWFQYCTDLWFTGYDPPRTLVPAAAMAPPVTTNDPAASITVPQASATHDPGVKKTAAVWNSIPLPPPFGHARLPKETNTVVEPKPQAPKPTNQVPIIEPQTPWSRPAGDDSAVKHQDSSHPGSGSTDPSKNPNVQSSSNGDSGMPGALSGKTNVQGSRGDSTLSGDPYSDESKDPASTVQNQIIDPGNLESTKDADVEKTTMLLAGHTVVVGPSDVRVDNVEVRPNQAPASVSGVAAINQGNSIVVASQILHLPVPTEQATTTIAGQAVVPIANGVLVQGIPVTGASPVIISGTTFSVDDSRLYLGSKSYKLPTANAAKVTLVNGVVALPISNAVSIYGTTLTVGAPAATLSGTTVSLDSASNLIFNGTAQALPSSPQTTSELGQVTTINDMAVRLLPSGISVAGTTLTPGAPAITTSGTSVSLGSTVLAVSNNTQFGVQGFEGIAGEHLRSLISKSLIALTIAVNIILYLHM